MHKNIKYNNGVMKASILKFLLFTLVIFMFTSCVEQSGIVLPVVEDYDADITIEEKKHLRLGTSSDTYAKMYLEAIQPILAKKGYTVEFTIYGDYIRPNLALANGEIDLNMFQHLKYLNNFKFEYDLDLSAIAEIPTASMGIYSSKHTSLDDLENGAKVSIPSDATNLSRALIVLEAARLIILDSYADKSKATVEDIIYNPKNLKFNYFEAPHLAKSLENHDLSIINGGFALSAGLRLSEALYNEILAENYVNVIAIRTSDLDKQYVQDIIKAVDSEEFKNVITNADSVFSGFQFPH